MIHKHVFKNNGIMVIGKMGELFYHPTPAIFVKKEKVAGCIIHHHAGCCLLKM